MRRTTPLEQVQIATIELHALWQVGRLVECGRRKVTERGLLPSPSP